MFLLIAEFTFIQKSPGTPWALITIMGLFAVGLMLLAILLLRRKR